MTNHINDAVKILKEGGIILYPTETVWGLGCDATNETAIKKILEIKQRPFEKGMIILVNSSYMVEQYVEKVPQIAWQLTEVSDEPLTIVYPKARNLPDILLSEDGSTAIRITSHPICREIINRFKKPIVSTSANFSGEKFPLVYKDIPISIRKAVDYCFDHTVHKPAGSKPSSIIKIGIGGEIEIIRK